MTSKDVTDFAEQGGIAGVFGDGTHPTTRLATAAITEIVARRRGARVLDVGTGTGVLVRAALAAGAVEAVGIDHDRRAIDTARAVTMSQFAAGSMSGALRGTAAFRVADAGEYLAQTAGGAFDVVVANLPDPPLTMLSNLLAAAARPGGVLVVTGVLLWQADALATAITVAGARVISRHAEGGWAILVCDC